MTKSIYTGRSWIVYEVYAGAEGVNRLPDIDDVNVAVVGTPKGFYRFRDILRRHNKENRFGIFMLHKHFELRDGELLFEDISEDRRVSIVEPVSESDSRAQGSTPVAWALRSVSSDNLQLNAIQWYKEGSGGYPDTLLSESDVMCLYELFIELKTHHLDQRFGVCLIDRLKYGPGEMIMERNDTMNRVSVTKTIPRTPELVKNSIQTMWTSKEDVGWWCHKHCQRNEEYRYHENVHDRFGG